MIWLSASGLWVILRRGSSQLEAAGSRLWCDSASDIRLNRRQSHGVLAGDLEAFERSNARLRDAGTRVDRDLYGFEGSRLETHRERLLDFSKDFIQTLVCESAL
jgi:hypothetical protein